MKDEALNELIELINGHDFYWRFSDDQRRWDKGFSDNQRIKELMKNYVTEDVEPFIKDGKKEAFLLMS